MAFFLERAPSRQIHASDFILMRESHQNAAVRVWVSCAKREKKSF